HVPNRLGNLLYSGCRVDRHEPVGLRGGAVEERLAGEGMELLPGSLQAVQVTGDPLGKALRIEIEEDRQARLQLVRSPQVQTLHPLRAQLPAHPLIGDRGVEIAVRDDDLAGGERWAHDRVDV